MKREDYQKLTEKEKENLIEKFKDEEKEKRETIRFFVEEIVYPIIKNENDIETISLDPNYQYNDEGYSFHYIMPFINGERYGYDEIMEEIDLALGGIASLIHDEITIDVQELKINHQKNELDTKLEKKPSKVQKKYRFKF